MNAQYRPFTSEFFNQIWHSHVPEEIEFNVNGEERTATIWFHMDYHMNNRGIIPIILDQMRRQLIEDEAPTGCDILFITAILVIPEKFSESDQGDSMRSPEESILPKEFTNFPLKKYFPTDDTPFNATIIGSHERRDRFRLSDFKSGEPMRPPDERPSIVQDFLDALEKGEIPHELGTTTGRRRDDLEDFLLHREEEFLGQSFNSIVPKDFFAEINRNPPLSPILGSNFGHGSSWFHHLFGDLYKTIEDRMFIFTPLQVQIVIGNYLQFGLQAFTMYSDVQDAATLALYLLDEKDPNSLPSALDQDLYRRVERYVRIFRSGKVKECCGSRTCRRQFVFEVLKAYKPESGDDIPPELVPSRSPSGGSTWDYMKSPMAQ